MLISLMVPLTEPVNEPVNEPVILEAFTKPVLRKFLAITLYLMIVS